MKKRAIAILLAMIMTMTMIPSMAFAESDAAAPSAVTVPSTAVFAEKEYSLQEFSEQRIYYDTVTYSDVKSCVVADTSVAKVTKNNWNSYVTVTGVKRGTTTLTVTLTNGVTETYTINVTPGDFVIEDYPYNYTMDRGDYDYVEVSKGFKAYTWSVDNESVIEIEDSYLDNRKKIIAVGKGEAMISVTNEHGDFTSVIITVTGEEFTIEDSANPTIAIRNGGLQYIDLPYSSDYKWEECTYEIADPSVVAAIFEDKSYSSGINCRLNALKPGDTTMTVHSKYGETVICNIHVYSALTELKFTEDEYTVWLGQPFQLPYNIAPLDSNNKIKFTVSSWYDDIISISEDGVVTPLKEGTAYNVEMESEDYCGDECDIIVKAPYFECDTWNLYRKQDVQLLLHGVSSDTVWSSSNTAVATVSADGTVVAKKAGTAIITASTGGVTAKTTVKVSNPKLSKAKAAIYAGKTLKLNVTGGVGKAVWKSSNPKVAAVNSNGKVTAKKAGTATISVNVSGMTLKCKVTVKGPELSVKKKTLIAKQTFNLKVNGATKKVKWSTSNKKIAAVNQKGKITAKKPGTATITAKVNGKTLKCKVTVKKNQITYKVNLDVNQYRYGEPAVVLKKAYFEGNKLKVDLYVINNRIFDASKFDWLIYKLYDNNGKLIANQKFTNVKLNVKAGGSKKITLTFKDSAVKQKNAILNYGVSDYYSYWYYYNY